MRKHRLAERLLVDVIGLEWEHVHAEACRWEHVMSEAVERKLVRCSTTPRCRRTATRSPGWTSWPAAGRAGGRGGAARVRDGLQRLDELARRGGGPVEVRRIAEHVQVDAELMAELKAAGVVPGNDVEVGAIARFGDAVPVARRRAPPAWPRWSRTRCWCGRADRPAPRSPGPPRRRRGPVAP